MESTGKPRKRARGTLNAHQRKKPKQGYTPGNDLAAFLIRKALYLPQFLDSNGEPYEIFKDAPIAQFISVMMTGPAREFFDYRMGTSSVNYQSPRYPELFDYVERFSGERGSSFALLKEVETTSGKKWYQRTNVMGWGGANASIFMESNLGIDEDLVQRGLLYASGFNDKVISDVIETLEVQYKVYYNLYGDLIKENEGIPVNIPPFKPIYPTFEFDGVRYDALDPKLHIYTLIKSIINVDVFAQGYGDFLTRMERMVEAAETGTQMPEGRTKLITWEIDRTQAQELRQMVDMATQEVGFPVGLSMNMESSIIKEGIRLQRTEPTRDEVDLGPTVSYDLPLEQRVRLAWTRNKIGLLPFIELFETFSIDPQFQTATVGTKPRRLDREQKTLFGMIAKETEKYTAMKRKDGFRGKLTAFEVDNLVPNIDVKTGEVTYEPFEFDSSYWGRVTKAGPFYETEIKNVQQLGEGMDAYAFAYGCKQVLLATNESLYAKRAVYFAQQIGFYPTKFIDITWKQRAYGVEFQVGGSKDFELLLEIMREQTKKKVVRQEEIEESGFSDQELERKQRERITESIDDLTGYLKFFMGYVPNAIGMTSSRDYRTAILNYVVTGLVLQMSTENGSWLPTLNAEKINMPIGMPWTPTEIDEQGIYSALLKALDKKPNQRIFSTEIVKALTKYYANAVNKKFLIYLDTLAQDSTLFYDLRMSPCNIMFQPGTTRASEVQKQLTELGNQKTVGNCTIKQAASKMFGDESFLQIIADCEINPKKPTSDISAFDRYRGQRLDDGGRLRITPFLDYLDANDEMKHVVLAFMMYCKKAFTTQEKYERFILHTFGVSVSSLLKLLDVDKRDDGYVRRTMADFEQIDVYVYLRQLEEENGDQQRSDFTELLSVELEAKSIAYWEFLGENALAMHIAKRKNVDLVQPFPLKLPKEVQEVLNYDMFSQMIETGKLPYTLVWERREIKDKTGNKQPIYDVGPKLKIVLPKDVTDAMRTYVTHQLAYAKVGAEQVVYSDTITHVRIDVPLQDDVSQQSIFMKDFIIVVPIKDEKSKQPKFRKDVFKAKQTDLSSQQKELILKDLRTYQRDVLRKKGLSARESEDVIILKKQLKKLASFKQTRPIVAKIQQLQQRLATLEAKKQAELDRRVDAKNIAWVMPTLYVLYVKALSEALMIPNVIDAMDIGLNTFDQDKIDKATKLLVEKKKVALPIIVQQVLTDM